jgi:hypothetical protein
MENVKDVAQARGSPKDCQAMYGSTGDPFVYYWCSACTPSGMGNFWGEHHFLVPQQMWLNWNSI